MTGEAPSEPKPVNGWLMIGLVTLPSVFFWLLLRRGYSNSLRTVVFIYAYGLALLYTAIALLMGEV